MKNTAQWYLIEQEGLFHVYPKEGMEKLNPDTYTIQKVFDTRREALTEMGRLIQLEIADVKAHVNQLAKDP